MSLKNNIKIKTTKIKVRRSWGVLKPVTRVKESKKIYNRDKEKNTIKKVIKEVSDD